MEENNRKGPGAFYAVIGVATLLVAVVGATFAFFSANAAAEIPEGTIAAAGGVDLVVTPVTATNTNLVPLNLIPNQTANADGGFVDSVDQFASAMANGCIDENKNNVCQVYRIVVTNKSTTSTISVRGTLTLTSDAANMYWRLISATDDNGDPAKLTSGSKVDYSTDVVASTSGGLGNLTVGGNSVSTLGGEVGQGGAVASHTLGATATATYYVVIWLEEKGAAQEDVDASRTFSGSVFFSAVDANGNNTGITASFTQA